MKQLNPVARKPILPPGVWPMASQFVELYKALDFYPFRKEVAVDRRWQLMLDFCADKFKQKAPHANHADPIPLVSLSYPVKTKHIGVSFSAGKDSLAAALKCRAQGRRVVLHHCKDLYPGRKSEFAAAKAIADAAKFEFVFTQCAFEGKSVFIEHPMIKAYASSLMIDKLSREGIRMFTKGNQRDDTMAADSGMLPEWSIGESQEYITLFDMVCRSVYGAENITVLKSETEAISVVCEQAPELWPHVQSCLLSNFKRGRLNKINRANWSCPMDASRCGSCWKCAQEYLMLAAYGIYPVKKAYIHKCSAILMKNKNDKTPTEKPATSETALDFWYDLPFLETKNIDLKKMFRDAGLMVGGIKVKKITKADYDKLKRGAGR